MGKKYICEQILYFLSDIKEKEEKKREKLDSNVIRLMNESNRLMKNVETKRMKHFFR